MARPKSLNKFVIELPRKNAWSSDSYLKMSKKTRGAFEECFNLDEAYKTNYAQCEMIVANINKTRKKKLDIFIREVEAVPEERVTIKTFYTYKFVDESKPSKGRV